MQALGDIQPAGAGQELHGRKMAGPIGRVGDTLANVVNQGCIAHHRVVSQPDSLLQAEQGVQAPCPLPGGA